MSGDNLNDPLWVRQHFHDLLPLFATREDVRRPVLVHFFGSLLPHLRVCKARRFGSPKQRFFFLDTLTRPDDPCLK